MFKIGDVVVRVKFNDWWNGLTNDRGKDRFKVLDINADEEIKIKINNQTLWAKATNFKLSKEETKEEKLLNKINKLYKKCKTTSHWAKENV